MRPQDRDFEDGRSYGIEELTKKLEQYATETGNSRVIEIVCNALYHVKKDEK